MESVDKMPWCKYSGQTENLVIFLCPHLLFAQKESGDYSWKLILALFGVKATPKIRDV